MRQNATRADDLKARSSRRAGPGGVAPLSLVTQQRTVIGRLTASARRSGRLAHGTARDPMNHRRLGQSSGHGSRKQPYGESLQHGFLPSFACEFSLEAGACQPRRRSSRGRKPPTAAADWVLPNPKFNQSVPPSSLPLPRRGRPIQRRRRSRKSECSAEPVGVREYGARREGRSTVGP
jgi:hypothetical protein